MFLLLTRILLWIAIAIVIYLVMLKFIPRKLLAFFGALVLFAIVSLAFLNPNTDLGVFSDVLSLLSLPFKPLGLSLLLLLIALFKGEKGDIGSPGRYLVGAAFLILLLSSMPFIAYSLAQQVEQEAINVELRRQEICAENCPVPLTPPALQPVGAIVVLGRGTTQATLPSPGQIQLTDTSDRILYAAQLYQQQLALGNTPIVIVSAGSRNELTADAEQQVEARDIANLLQILGVDRSQILLEPTSLDLRSSAVEVQEILASRGLSNLPIFLVTSAINIRRATLTFSNLGLRVIPRPTDFYTLQIGETVERNIRIKDFVPSVKALVITTRVVEEYLGSIYYFLRGWLSPTIL